MATNKDFVVKNGLRVGEDVVITGNVSAANFVGSIELANTGVVANTYGSASLIPVVTVDADGRISNVSTVSVAGVSDFAYESSNAQLVISTADGSSYSANIDLTAFSTTDLSEGTNQYFTTARANSAIDARVTQSFVNALNVDADTLDGQQGSYYASVTYVDSAVAAATGSDLEIAFTDDLDLGLVVDNANTSYDFDSVANTTLDDFDLGLAGQIGKVQLPYYVVRDLPAADSVVCENVLVIDEVGGTVPAFSDGTNWRRITDRQIVSA